MKYGKKKGKNRTAGFLPGLFAGLTVMLLLGGCRKPLTYDDLPLGTVSAPDGWSTDSIDDYDELKESFLQSFEMEKVIGSVERSSGPLLTAGPDAPSSRATVPLQTSKTFTDGTLENYPEQNLTTSYSVVSASDIGEDIYRIMSTTTYPESNTLLDTYIEQYLVKDTGEKGIWDIDDPVVDNSGEEDRTYREKMEVHFDDGSVRYEQIVKQVFPDSDEEGFAAFDIAGGLDYPGFSYPDSDPDAQYSSVVVYSQEISTSYDYWFWEGEVTGALLGVRYYTEHYTDDMEYYKGTLVSYERGIETYATNGGDFAKQMKDVFIGSEHTTLAESVLRKEVVFASPGGAVDPVALGGNTVMRTHVVDTAGSDNTDQLLQQLNDDAALFADWDSATWHIPSGDTTDEIIDNDADAEVTVELYADNPDGSQLPLLVDSVDSSSDLASLYRSISDEAAKISVSNDLPSVDDADSLSLMDDYGIALFDQNEGNLIPDSDNSGAPGDPGDVRLNPLAEGTVEAWVWVDAHADTAGIVHKGIETDFSDEGYSLQFWGSKGNVVFGIVEQEPNYHYTLAQSSLRLNKKKWYYLVGRWDSATVYLDIFYSNGSNTVHKEYSVNNTVTGRQPYEFSGPLVIGSQFMENYGVNGYYGFDGKINGVEISRIRKADNVIEDFYNANKDKTSSW